MADAAKTAKTVDPRIEAQAAIVKKMEARRDKVADEARAQIAAMEAEINKERTVLEAITAGKL